ncbi:Septin-type guanine nucleotide-binding (G) domain-containing protein, partial [Syncephalis pseudoplumigaleata]
LLTFLENQFDARLIEESRVKRNPKALHRQLHACLYFLDPSHAGLRPVDVSVIRSLCERVNVIPVIAMADTLTVERMRRVRRAIRKDIRVHRLHIYSFPEGDEDDEDERKSIDADEDADALSPQAESNGHATATSHEHKEQASSAKDVQAFLGRRYPWGDVLVMKPAHCDVAVLRTLLLDTQRRLLRDTTVEVLYERYRTERM